jgi:hypothetical protein
MLSADVRIFLLEVVLQAALALLDKLEMGLTLVVRVQLLSIAINLVCVREFLNQIFLKM